jgi:hypothetical protein
MHVTYISMRMFRVVALPDGVVDGLGCYNHLIILLDSHLVILQLKNVYHVCDPYIFHKFLQVRLLSQNFDSITFTHIPRQFYQTTDNMDNTVLDWHLSHQDIITHTKVIKSLSQHID